MELIGLSKLDAINLDYIMQCFHPLLLSHLAFEGKFKKKTGGFYAAPQK